MKTTHLPLLVLLSAVPAVAQDIGAVMPQAREAVMGARSFKPWPLSHRNGVLQQINDAVAHLTAETKPSVAMVRVGQGTGTGFIVDRDGLMITNAHVVLEAGLRAKVKLLFADGSEHEGVIVAVGTMGTREEPLSGRDLALIKLPRRKGGWPALRLADSVSLREGHLVAMMGYPLGLPFTVTQGVVGGLDHRDGGSPAFPVKFAQSDAAINPGNSGGPLMAMSGEVVGVNTLSFSPSGGSDGIGLSVGIDAVKAFLAEYRRRGPFSDAPSTARREAGAGGAAGCPAPEQFSQPWMEHGGALPQAVLDAHLRAAFDAASPILLPVNGVSWWLGVSRRGRGQDADPACAVLGSAAFYANGMEDSPTVDFVSVAASNGESRLRPQLVELRWFDPADGRKHRWFDAALARRLGWDTDGRGAPTDDPRPIPLPDAVNELF